MTVNSRALEGLEGGGYSDTGIHDAFWREGLSICSVETYRGTSSCKNAPDIDAANRQPILIEMITS
jgi:hypothetical protein